MRRVPRGSHRALRSAHDAGLIRIRADWSTRPPVVEGYRREAMGVDARGDQIHVVSHVVDGHRHFGALRFPRSFIPGKSRR